MTFAHHFLRLMMLSAERKELSSMQNLIARYIAEKYRNLPEFDICEENCYKDVVFLELLSRAAVQNPSITIMCREMIPFGRLEVLFEKHSNPAVLSSLLSFLTYVYLWPVDDKSVKPLNPFSVLGKIVAKLHATQFAAPTITTPDDKNQAIDSFMRESAGKGNFRL